MMRRNESIFKRFIVMLIVFAMTLTCFPMSSTTAIAATSKDENAEIAFKYADYRIMSVGQSYSFKILNNSKDSKAVWESSNPSVAKVSKKGVVKAVAVGSTTITCTVTSDGEDTVLQAKVYVKKESNNPASSIEITNKIDCMAVGEKYDFVCSLEPKKAVDFVNWISSNPTVASVDKNGVVIAKSSGTVVIKAAALNGQAYDKVKIKISDSQITAMYGSPVIDGKVDAVWKNACEVVPTVCGGQTTTSAKFRTMWDDNAFYVLAQVKDANMSVAAGNPYEQDSMEVFLDENNDKTQEFGTDDLQFRINYENKKTADKGDIARLYSQTRKVKGGYVIEARIEFQNVPANDKVLGIELQINDGKDTSRLATLNVFDLTGGAWNNTALFGSVILKGKTAGVKDIVNPYKLLSLIDSTEKINLSEYTNGDTLTAAITIAREVLKDKKVTQAQVDAQYEAIQSAIDGLTYTKEAAKVKRYVPVPTEYKGENEKAGKIVSMNYDLVIDGKTVTKPVNVYLPYGYDEKDTTKKYNVLYLMHGGGENVSTIFGGAGESRELKRIIDNMIAKGEIDPLIVVTPSFTEGYNDASLFYKELDTLIPAVEKKYNTYLTTGDVKDIEATREHRAFGGFSMGSVCTWTVFINYLDYFKYFLPLSGDCWAFNDDESVKNAEDKPLAIAKKLEEVVKNAGYNSKDFYILCATGSQDIAYPNVNPQIEALKTLTDTFRYSGDLKEGNFYFIVADGGTHAWNFVNQYIYDILPDLFQ